MKAQDIVNKLAESVPLYTDGFSTSIPITSITVSGTTATATANNHGLIEGQNVSIIGAEAPVQIDASSFLRVGTFAQFKTLQDHDLTLSERDKASGGKTITISGAVESEFNGTFDLVRVINRREIIISVADSGATTISGLPIIEDANGGIFNGFAVAENVTTNTFDYELPIPYTLDAVVANAFVQTEIRITSVIDINQYLVDVYTKQLIDADQLVVQLGDVSISKKRNEETDSSSSTVGNDSYAPIMIQSFAIYIVMNATDDLTGSELRDKVESEYIPAIFKSVAAAKFDTGFTYNQYRATPTGHGVFAFSDENGKNKAVYAHEVTFEQLAQLTRSADMAGPDDSVAMRDVEYRLTTSIGGGELNADVDLDEEPI